MRLIYLLITVGISCQSSVFGQSDSSRLGKEPDLRPFLSLEESSLAFGERKKRMTAALKDLTDAQNASLRAAFDALAPAMPHVNAITLYSLHPISDKDVEDGRKGDATGINPDRFHGYPVLGKIEIEDAPQANRWTDFLRDQIIPGSFLLCEFEPRHGFRLSTDNGDIDFLMCFKCSQLGVRGPIKVDNTVNPVFSKAVEDLVNTLFDKRLIKRDTKDPINEQDGPDPPVTAPESEQESEEIPESE